MCVKQFHYLKGPFPIYQEGPQRISRIDQISKISNQQLKNTKLQYLQGLKDQIIAYKAPELQDLLIRLRKEIRIKQIAKNSINIYQTMTIEELQVLIAQMNQLNDERIIIDSIKCQQKLEIKKQLKQQTYILSKKSWLWKMVPFLFKQKKKESIQEWQKKQE